jgi:tetratricopeptide (TPR) repeat protein
VLFRSDLLILHHGYTAEVISEKNKVQRNYELLVKALEERPNEAYFYMQLGLELRRMDRLAESFDAYAKALDLTDTQPNQIITDEVRETLLTQYSGYLLADKQYEKVVEVLTSDLAFRQPLTPGQLLVRGRALIHLRQPQYALTDVQEAYSRREEETLYPSAIDPMSAAAEVLLAEVFYLNKYFKEAITCFEKVLQNNILELRIILVYSACLDAVGKTVEALEFLRRKAHILDNNPEIWMHGAKLVLKHAELKEAAESWLNEARSHYPDFQIKRIG